MTCDLIWATPSTEIIYWTSRDEHERCACRYARVKFNLSVRVNATQMTWKRSREWSCECSFAKCDVRFVGKRQAHSKFIQLIIFPL